MEKDPSVPLGAFDEAITFLDSGYHTGFTFLTRYHK
jgi:hypothetical protein